MVAACTFLVRIPSFCRTCELRFTLVNQSTLVHRTAIHDELAENKQQLLQAHGRAIMKAVLWGFAGVAPRSVVPNLIEMLGTLIVRCDGLVVGRWISEILFAVSPILWESAPRQLMMEWQDDFVPSKATPQAKERLIKSLLGYVLVRALCLFRFVMGGSVAV